VNSLSSESGKEKKRKSDVTDNESDVKPPPTTHKKGDFFVPTLAMFEGVPSTRQSSWKVEKVQVVPSRVL